MKNYLKIEYASSHFLCQQSQEALIDRLWNRLNIKKEGSILDIGPGNGFFSDLFHKNGYKVSQLDVDESKKEYFEKKGYIFRGVNLRKSKIPFSENSFDLIWCSHVIEHLDDTHEFLVDCHRVLKNGGLLIIRTPDLKKVRFDFWHDPTHKSPFIKISLKKAFLLAGYTVVFNSNSEMPNIRGLHRIRAYKWVPNLVFMGENLICVGRADK